MNNLNHSSSALDVLLARAAGRTRQVALAAALAWIVFGAMALVLSAMLLDAACALPEWALRAEQALFGAAAVAGVILLVRAWRRPMPSAAALARTLEAKLNLASSTLSNAVDLQSTPPPGASSILCAEAIRQGEAAAQALPPKAAGQAADTGALRCGTKAACAALLLAVLVFGLFPGLLRSGLPRLFHPSAGYAAYTPLHFEIVMTPHPVIEGDPVAIRATITGTGVPDEAWLVFLRGEAGTETDERVPMPQDGANPEHGRFASVLDHPTQTRRFYVETLRGRSGILTLSVLAVPRIEAVSAELHPPAYTGWADTRQRVGPAGVALLEGGEARFQIDCSMPVTGAKVRFTPDVGQATEAACLPDPKNPRRLLLTWPVTVNGALEVIPHGAAGLAARTPLRTRVTAIPDAPPSIRIVEPEPLLYAAEGDRVVVRVFATDDVAVAKVVAVRAANNWGPFSAPVVFKPLPETGCVAGEWTFDLGALGAKAGDVITYSAVAFDNRPEVPGASGAAKRGPQRAETEKQAIRVISRAEFLRHLREEKRVGEIAEEAHQIQAELADLKAAREEALKAVAAIQGKLDQGKPLTNAERAALAKAAAKSADFAKAARAAGARLAKRAAEPAAYDFEKKYRKDMAQLANELEQQAKLADAATDFSNSAMEETDPSVPAQKLANQAWEQFRQQKDPFGNKGEVTNLDEDAKDLDKLAATDALKSLEDELKALALDQAELEKGMARFSRRDTLTPDEKLLSAQLGERQEELRQQFADVTGDMEKLLHDDGESIPEQAAKARALLNALMQENVAQDLADATTLARTGEGRMAHAAAAQAAEKLLRLLKPSAKDAQDRADAADDLENALDMDQDAVGECLGQMDEGRGEGQGQASGAGQGKGQGKGQGRGRGRGGRASGAGGSRARGANAGKPNIHGAVDGDQGQKSGSADGRGKGAGHGGQGGGGDHAADGRRAESIEAGKDAARNAQGQPMPGVPPVYRALTEQYFKRVLEDSSKTNGGQP